jgi:hypothetical protein
MPDIGVPTSSEVRARTGGRDHPVPRDLHHPASDFRPPPPASDLRHASDVRLPTSDDRMIGRSDGRMVGGRSCDRIPCPAPSPFRHTPDMNTVTKSYDEVMNGEIVTQVTIKTGRNDFG